MNDSHNERVTKNIQSKIFIIMEHSHYEQIASESEGNPRSSRYERRSRRYERRLRRFEQRVRDVDAHCNIMGDAVVSHFILLCVVLLPRS